MSRPVTAELKARQSKPVPMAEPSTDALRYLITIASWRTTHSSIKIGKTKRSEQGGDGT